MKNFIAVSSLIENNKLTYLCDSKGDSIYNENGLSFEKAIDFLFDLIRYRRKSKTVFVNYGFAQTYEYLFASLSKDIKDKVFKSETVKRKINAIEFELDEIESQFYNSEKTIDELANKDFNKFVNRLALKELTEVKYKDYFIELIQGKVLTIRKKGKAISFYDVFGFFKPKSLYEAVQLWLQKDIFILQPVMLNLSYSELKNIANVKALLIAELAEKLNSELTANNINLSRFYGASAVASNFLNKTKAKTEYHSYAKKYQLSPLLWKAQKQSFYAGRSEQFKLGTIKNVKIYDINSAYAFACLNLPTMLAKPKFSETYTENSFGVWFCEYNFLHYNNYFGLLPNRSFSQSVNFRVKGKSFFWHPEIEFIQKHYPNCIKIKYGFVFDGEKAKFTNDIQKLYDLRLELQANNNPLEKIIKLSLSSLYGKFCQSNGASTFYNLFYAGFITSLTRSMLLDATIGKEKNVICFQTDAIHTTDFLDISVSNKLGDWKLTEYEKVTYLDNGVYQCYNNGEVVKTKTRGFQSFDFENALQQIKTKNTFEALNKLFIGHNLYTARMFGKRINGNKFDAAKYLEVYEENQEFEPITRCKNSNRIFENKHIDFESEFIDSRMNNLSSGQESVLYNPRLNYHEAMLALESANV